MNVEKEPDSCRKTGKKAMQEKKVMIVNWNREEGNTEEYSAAWAESENEQEEFCTMEFRFSDR